MKLLIVESPTKCAEVRRILHSHEPGQWRVFATAGRWRSLPDMTDNEFSDVVDPTRGFIEKFDVDPAKIGIEEKLQEEISGASEIFIATDDDREGEAVVWHIAEHFCLKEIRRVRFRQVTPRTVLSGIRNAGSLDMPLVDSQRARAVVDYLIGMEVSRLIWRFGCKSAGRLQSCALRILTERERAREAFKIEKFWTLRVDYRGALSAVLGDSASPSEDVRRMDAALGSQPLLVPKRFVDNTEAVEFARKFENVEHVVADVISRPESRQPPPPLTTSELLAEAAARFGFSSDKVASAARSLFEKGAITDPRTDSTAVADDGVVDIRSYLGAHHPKLFPNEPIGTRLASRARTAHEAIRPTKMTRVPKAELSLEEHAIYELIFLRSLCSQALPAEVECVTVTIRPVGSAWTLTTAGRVVRKSGWLELDPDLATEDFQIPAVEIGDPLDVARVELVASSTKPPPRFTEATLIRYLEQRCIGRPSTYVEMLRKMRDRGYVAHDVGELVPLELGRLADELVTLGFEQLTREDFTANTERALDAIASGEIRRVEFLEAFYEKFRRFHADAVVAFERFEKAHPQKRRGAGDS